MPIVAPWVAWQDCEVTQGGAVLAKSQLWQEKIIHLALGGANHFYFDNTWAIQKGCKPATLADSDLMSALLLEIDSFVGCAPPDRQWVTDPSARYEDEFILTGMDVGADRRAWRLTPQLDRNARNVSEANLTWAWDSVSGELSVGPVGFYTSTNRSIASTLHAAGANISTSHLQTQGRSTRGRGQGRRVDRGIVMKCTLVFPWGQVVVADDESITHGGVGTVAPLGVWIVQSRPPLPVTVKCPDGTMFPWPIDSLSL